MSVRKLFQVVNFAHLGLDHAQTGGAIARPNSATIRI
jgi:hypothetical protein